MSSIKDFPVYESSPYVKKGVVQYKFRRKSVMYAPVDSDTGQIGDPGHFLNPPQDGLKDTFTYIKIFKEGLGVIEHLSKRGRRILWHLLKELKPGQELVDVPYLKMSAEHKGLKNNNFYYGMVDLLKHGVLARAPFGQYFINTNMFYNGDRKKKYIEQQKNDQS